MVFNLLELLGFPGLELVWDFIAFIVSFILILMLVQINAAIEKSGKLSTTVTRKVIHTFAAPLWVVTWVLFSGSVFSRWLALIVPLLFVILFVAIGTGKMVNEDFVSSMSRSGDPKELLGGTLYYAFLMMVVAVLWFYVPADATLANATPLALIVFGCLAGGDGLADVIGRKYGGEKKFGIGGAEKTLAGTIGMFIGSVLSSIILVFLFSIEVSSFALIDLLLPIIVVSIVATIVEALTPKGLDNITITIAAIVMCLILPYIGLFWPYPLFTLF
ncbi:MAG: phosphatidate cytidylyltransferase [Candidatus Thorarchaeota archaeon]|nr:phosphatidate cytidylyltransferase [Candidatus Thorarchaeota archaeon]